jgi:hypothetical protein
MARAAPYHPGGRRGRVEIFLLEEALGRGLLDADGDFLYCSPIITRQPWLRIADLLG